jgi:hypothetical protein
MSRSTLVYMTPDEFLNLAPDFIRPDSPQRKRTGPIENAIVKGEKLPVPYLRITDKGGVATVTSHEGRHRASVLKRLGVAKMPVVLKSDRIVWDSQDNNIDKLDDKWPTQLNPQDPSTVDKNAVNTGKPIPFPVPEPKVRKAKPNVKKAKPSAKKVVSVNEKKPPAVKKFAEDKLAYRNKPLPNEVYQQLAALKAATSPQEGATSGRQVLANYLHAYETPEGALAAIAAESNVDYTLLENKKLAATVVDVQKARTYINNNMGAPVKKAFRANEDLVAQEIESVQRRNAKEKKDADIRKKSKFGRSKTAEDLKDVGAGTKGAKAVAKKKKEEVGETPAQIAKRLKDEEKARLDAEAESLASLEEQAAQTGTVGYVASIIKNADKIAQKTEADLNQKARSNEWVKFIASLPKTKQKPFLDSYTRISKENPNLIPESVRARVVKENKKILSQKDQKRASKV